MKKKILSLCLVCCLVAVAAIGGTLAYFTDTDTETNTFTTTGVDIKLIEQQRETVVNEETQLPETVLKPFENEKVLYPIVGSAQGAKDEFGMPTAANYQDKIVTVQNLKADAYVRVYIAIPAALMNRTDSSKDILHWNWGNKFTAAGDYDTTATPQPQSADYTANMGPVTELTGVTNIDGIDYVVCYQTYKKALVKNEVTGSAFMIGMYLDKDVNTREETVTDPQGGNTTKTVYTITRNGQTTDINFDFANGVKIPVFAVGAQAKGFADADTAINAAFGANYNPWATV